MWRLRHRATALLSIVCVSACGQPDSLHLQETAQSLPKMTGRIEEGFTLPESPIEFADGSVVVSDRPHRELWKLNFESGKREPHGRSGDGPGEYRHVHGLLGLPGDTVAATEVGGWFRLALVSPDGQPVHTRTLFDITRVGEQISRMDQLPHFLATDSTGRFYGTALARAPVIRGEARHLDSLPIIRYSMATERFDTVGIFPTGDLGAPRQLAPPASGWRLGTGPFAARNAWVVSPSGAIYFVDASTYSIGRITRDGVEITGQRAGIREVPLASGAWELHVATTSKMLLEGFDRMVGAALAPGGGRAPAPREHIVADAPTYYPPVMLGVRSRVHMARGELWVPVPHTRVQRVERWEVVDTTARLLATYELPPHSMLLGVTDHNLYVSQKDDDELHSVVRYPNPRGLLRQQTPQ